MQIENHPHFLHCLKNGVIHLITLDTSFRVGSDASRVRFDTDDACCFSFMDFGGCEVWGEVKSH